MGSAQASQVKVLNFRPLPTGQVGRLLYNPDAEKYPMTRAQSRRPRQSTSKGRHFYKKPTTRPSLLVPTTADWQGFAPSFADREYRYLSDAFSAALF
jgi:hypothetical protein